METIYNLIKQEVKKHPLVTSSVLGAVDSWKRSHYIILSEIIKEDLAHKEELQNERKFELGTSISHITLQRFFESDYDYKTHNDLRFLKTLDKICIFLGYKNVNHFIQHVKKNSFVGPLTFDKEQSAEIIYKYCYRNFQFFKNLPEQSLETFDDLIFSDSPFIERIRNYSAELCEKGLKLVTKNNRSNYEIFDLEIITEEEDKVVVKTQEFWNLLFYAENSGEEYFINELSTQVYFIKKINNAWKIWDNYNPNSGILNHELQKKP